jgi:hypothetical protein
MLKRSAGLLVYQMRCGDPRPTRSCVVDDVQPLRHTGVFLLMAARHPAAYRSLIAFTAW